jgi:hypothetical protein
MRNILGRHRLQAVAVAAVALTLLATPSAGTTQNTGTTHNHDAHVHSANATAHAHSDQPHHTATLNRANPTFTWEGSGSGAPDPSHFLFGQSPPVRCTGTPFSCEHILLLVARAGELTLTLNGTDDGDVSDPTGEICGDEPCGSVKDIDGYLYKSNAAGERVGHTLTRDCVTGSSSETCKVAAGPGFYLVEVEHAIALEAHYIGTLELAVAPGRPAAQPQMVTIDDCNFTLYYFKDSAERLQALVPPGYRVAPYSSYVAGHDEGSPLVTTEGSATIAAAAYDCDRIDVPGSSPSPGIFTVLSVLVHPRDGTTESPATADYYVLWVHANNPQLVELLTSRGMPAHLVPGMVFEKPLQSLAVRVDVPWSPSPYELATTGFEQDGFHAHDNTFLHVRTDGRKCLKNGAGPHRGGCLARMDFVTHRARDQYCSQPADHHAVECGKLTAQEGTSVADFFGASDRTAGTAWDHEPVGRSWFFLQ